MLRVEYGGRELGPITASFGAATAPEHCAFGQLVQTADAALLRAKEAGRDRVVVAAARRRDEKPGRASGAESDQESESDVPTNTRAD